MFCDHCKETAGFTAVMKPASECKHMTGSGGMKWCKKCAEKKKVCEACGTKT